MIPVVLSVPHDGDRVPAAAAPYCRLTAADIASDGDAEARDIYRLDAEHRVVAAVARAIVDLNRPPDDRGGDGVLKDHTADRVAVYDPPLPPEVGERLLRDHYDPYHERLSGLAGSAPFGVDGHTMAARAPAVAPRPGVLRPRVCLSDGGGAFPPDWFRRLAACAEEAFGFPPHLNDPFRGGHITRFHGAEMPWVQIELRRGDWAPVPRKREAVRAMLESFCDGLPGPPGAPRRIRRRPQRPAGPAQPQKARRASWSRS